MQYLIQGSTLTNIADALRDTLNVPIDDISVTDMPQKILDTQQPILFGSYILKTNPPSWSHIIQEDYSINFDAETVYFSPLSGIKSKLSYITFYEGGDVEFEGESNQLYSSGSGWTGYYDGSYNLFRVDYNYPEPIVFPYPVRVSQQDYDLFMLLIDTEADQLSRIYLQEKEIIEGTAKYYVSFDLSAVKNNAFRNCSSLTKVYLEEATSLGQYAFQNALSLTFVEAEQVATLGVGTFDGCKQLSSVKLSSAINTIPSSCFKNTKISAMPGSPQTIGSWAFAYCSNFKSCTNTNNNLTIHNSAFYSASNLSYVSFPGCSYLGANVFEKTGLLSFVLPSLISQVPSYLLRSCKSLSTVTVGASCTAICPYAFYSCTNLTTLNLKSVNTRVVSLLNSNALAGCTKLSNILVPAHLIGSYKQATNWKYYSSKIFST